VNPPNFFAELKRRKICKVAVAYVLVALVDNVRGDPRFEKFCQEK
jgi:hypothetical protein